MFVDEIKLSVHSGAGGSGSVSFKKTSSKSSPSGGSGGYGGSVIITVNEELNDLSHIISNSSLKAENGTDGNKNFQNGKINEAKEICNEILKSEPDNFNAYYLLGVIAFQTRNYKQSEELISKAIEINSENFEFYNFIGDLK